MWFPSLDELGSEVLLKDAHVVCLMVFAFLLSFRFVFGKFIHSLKSHFHHFDRHRNPKTISKELDKEKMRSKKLIISTKRTELNHRMAQTYGKFEDLKLGILFSFQVFILLTFLLNFSEWRMVSQKIHWRLLHN